LDIHVENRVVDTFGKLGRRAVSFRPDSGYIVFLRR
jgi:hypothetical protein